LKLTKRDKKVVAFGVFIAGLILIKLLVLPVLERTKEMDEAVAAKKVLLEKYLSSMEDESMLKAKKEDLAKVLAKVEKQRLLKASTPVLAGARLQSIVKNSMRARGVEIRSIKIEKVRDAGQYKVVGLRIVSNSDLESLVDVIFDIENRDEALFIDYLNLRRQGRGDSPILRSELGFEAFFRPKT